MVKPLGQQCTRAAANSLINNDKNNLTIIFSKYDYKNNYLSETK